MPTAPTYNRRQILSAAAAVAVASALPKFIRAAEPAASPRLNLLLITADDLNADYAGWMGSKMGATPHLDAFAATACGFQHAHSTAPICQPSREAILTGRVPHRSGALGFDPVWPNVPTLWEVLHAAGYFTAACHKISHMQPASKFNWDMKYEAGAKNEEGPAEALPAGSRSLRDPATDYKFTTEAIQASVAKKQPFFININVADPHRPLYQTPDDRRAGGVPISPEFTESQVPIPGFLDDIPGVRTEVCQYYNSARRCDMSIGQTLKALDDSGLADRTIVAFMSDHGMPFPFAKTTLYGCGTRTPICIRYPGLPASRIESEQMISNIDIMPTLLDLLQIPHPPGMDGRSLTSILTGEKQPDRDHVFTHVTSNSAHEFFPGRCVRTKTSSYIFNSWANGKTKFHNESMQGLTWPAMKAAAKSNPTIRSRNQMFLFRAPEEFYDLASDPSERDNQIRNPAHATEISRLKSLLLAQMKATGDPLLKEFSPVAER